MDRAGQSFRSRVHGALRAAAVAAIRRSAPFAARRNWLTDAGVVDAGAPVGRTDPADAVPFPNFNFLLHALRTAELARMPPVSGTMLSAGCADAYYFEWVAASYRPVERHIGLELYMPRPDVLPANVEWIAASVGSMAGVHDASVQLVFSGQNIEHLFGDDLVGFLLEARRVLEPGGWLVVDSPHRNVATALNWTMAEHTTELTPDEAVELVTFAGFDVADVRGVWLCRDPRSGATLPLWSADGTGDGPPPTVEDIVQRSVRATNDPANSFVWWLEARRSDRDPDAEALRRRHTEIVAAAAPEHRSRLRSGVGDRTDVDGERVVSVPAGTAGYAMYGPWVPLAPGRYRVVFRVRAGDGRTVVGPVADVDVCDVQGTVYASRLVSGGELRGRDWVEIEVDVRASEIVWGAQFRVRSTGTAALDVRFDVDLEPRSVAGEPAPGPVVAG